MVNGPLLCALAFCAAFFSTCWAFVILEGFCSSSCLVAVFLFVLDISIAVVDVDKKEIEERESIADDIVSVIVVRAYYSKQL